MKQFETYGGDCTISYDDSPETHKKVFDYLLKHFYKKYGRCRSESICGMDDTVIDAPHVLGAIADMIFKEEWK